MKDQDRLNIYNLYCESPEDKPHKTKGDRLPGWKTPPWLPDNDPHVWGKDHPFMEVVENVVRDVFKSYEPRGLTVAEALENKSTRTWSSVLYGDPGLLPAVEVTVFIATNEELDTPSYIDISMKVYTDKDMQKVYKNRSGPPGVVPDKDRLDHYEQRIYSGRSSWGGDGIGINEQDWSFKTNEFRRELIASCDYVIDNAPRRNHAKDF